MPNIPGYIHVFHFNMLTENQLKIQNKLYELSQDCLKYSFCPICTNSIYSIRIGYKECTKCLFSISEEYDYFIFTINDMEYSFHIFRNRIYVYKFKSNYANDHINFEHVITDIDSLTLIQLYNNLKKYLVFK